MKKRIVCLLLALVMTLSLFACDNNDDPGNENNDPPFSEITNPGDGIPTPIVPI